MVGRSIDADRVLATLDRLACERGAPAFVRFDNGPEFIALAVADWRRFNGVGSIFIDPGSPWQNAWIESFNGRSATNCSSGLERSAVGTLVERTTRFTMLIHLPREDGYRIGARTKNGPALAGYGTIKMKNALAATMSTLPELLRRSLTRDR